MKLIVDEWGAWHRPGTEMAPWHLFGQTSTMRDALIAALTLDISIATRTKSRWPMSRN